MFQFLFNFESSVKLSFQQNSRVEFSFSSLTWYNFGSQLSFNFIFISWEASCVFEILISCSRSERRNLSVGYSFLPLQFGPLICTFIWFWFYFLGSFLPVWSTCWLFKKKVMKPFYWLLFLPLQFGPWIHTERPNNSSQQIVSGSFLVPYCLGLLFLSFPLWPNQVPHEVSLIFS